MKKRHIIMGAIGLVLITGLVYFFGFTSVGYFVTIQFRGYDEIRDKVYVDAGFPISNTEILSVLSEAEVRLNDFWGDVKSRPTIIISGNKNKLAKMGLKTSPALTTRIGTHSFVVVSSDGMNIDVMAHELTHAELYARLYAGKFPLTPLVPSWFDEGVALQNDYREKYNEEEWKKETDNGKNIVDLSEIDTLPKFHAGDENERRYRYIISKHELSGWLDKHGIEGLISLVDGVNVGKAFNDLYYAE
jgi:hypothetical protein